MRYEYKQRQGGSYIYVLFLLVMLSTLGIAALGSAIYGFKLEKASFQTESDFVHAEAAIHRYQFYLNLNEEYYQNNDKLQNEVKSAISEGLIREGDPYIVDDDKNIFIESITLKSDGTYQYIPKYYAYKEGYYSVLIDENQTITEEESIKKNTPQRTTIIVTYYKNDPDNGRILGIRRKKDDGSYESKNVKASIKRKIETQFARKQFTELAYLSDYEDEIWWGDREKFYGPFHTNGDLYVNGNPTFHGPVTYSGDVRGRRWDGEKIVTYPIEDPMREKPGVFLQGIHKVPPIEFPKTVTELKRLVDPNHIYTGVIRIRFDQNHPDQYFIQQMQSKEGNFDGVYDPNWGAEQGPIDFPKNGVIYVQNDLNPEMIDGKRRYYEIANMNIDPVRDSRNYSIMKSHYLLHKWGFDIMNSDYDREQTLTKGQQANVFVRGDLTGRLTIVSENNIYINGDIRYTERDKSLLGLIANYDVLVNHFDFKVNMGFARIDVLEDYGDDGIYIDGVIYAGRQFGYELYKDSRDYSKKGYINLNGAIINHDRGYVGEVNRAGFDKKYSYDERLQSTTPPYFIQPINAPWEIRYERERN